MKIPQENRQRRKPVNKVKKEVSVPSSEPIRLNKYISNSGVCSRRDADKLIEKGQIKVNGNVITELGFKVNPITDKVNYDGKPLTLEKPIYVLLNKPRGFITTVEDPEGRKTVMELVKTATNHRIYPVGRLDRMTTGLLLFTNDGDLAKKLSHPSGEVKKLYEVTLDKPITDEDYLKVEAGIELEDGIAKPDEMAIVSKDRRALGVQIHIGKNRIVRRIFEAIGYEVVKLDRVMYAGLTKKDIPRGKWRILSEKEIIKLKYLQN
ncbi:MAG: pseudouridine synthase [Bacteroidetes bacterium]|nr:pseudouridine synthase [Bacteroidota bacterium]MDA1120715.1 pseudouridine synthase [Bacteroidota bacterium]